MAQAAQATDNTRTKGALKGGNGKFIFPMMPLKKK